MAHLGFAARRQPTLSAVRPFAEVAPLLVLSYAGLVSADEPRLLARASERGYTSARLQQQIVVCAPRACRNPANSADTFNLYQRLKPKKPFKVLSYS